MDYKLTVTSTGYKISLSGIGGQGADGRTAYESAVVGGYPNSESHFNLLLGNLMTAAAAGTLKTETIPISSHMDPLTTGTSDAYFRMPYTGNLLAIKASVRDPSTTDQVSIVVFKNSVQWATVTIDANELSSKTSSVATTIASAAFNDDDLITFNVTSAGSGAIGAIVTFKSQVLET